MAKHHKRAQQGSKDPKKELKRGSGERSKFGRPGEEVKPS